MKDDCVSDCQRRDHQDCSGDYGERITPGSLASEQHPGCGAKKEREQQRIRSQPTGNSDQRAGADEIDESRVFERARQTIDRQQ